MNTFCERLKQLRIENNMTQEDLSKKINVSSSTISLYENGNREPSISILISIAKAFDVSVDYILGLTDIKRNKVLLDEVIERVIIQLNKKNGLK